MANRRAISRSIRLSCCMADGNDDDDGCGTLDGPSNSSSVLASVVDDTVGGSSPSVGS